MFQAVKASSMARSAAETALRRACVATQSAFEELSHEMSAWRCAQSKAAVRVNTESLPLVYPGPLTHLIALKTTVVVDAKPEPTN
jgi:hypothetical protein